MTSTDPTPGPLPAGTPRFATTRWSLVVAAGGTPGSESRRALASLCETYWYPLYAFARRRGLPTEEAQDRTQGFIAELLEKDTVQGADREKGRFRTFLLTAFKRSLGHAREKARAQKRGGGKTLHTLDVDVEAAEARYVAEPFHDWTPERIFERRWALTLLDRVLDRLRVELETAGKDEHFEAMKGYLTGDATRSHAETAEALGTSEGSVKVAVHRLRQRYRELLRTEIGDTVASPGDVDAELRHLLGALAGKIEDSV